MARHSERGTNGRFTPSGAPIPDTEGQGDTSAYALGDDRSAHPSTDPEAFPSFGHAYPDYDPAMGGYHRRINHRAQVEIDGITGGPEAPSFGIPGSRKTSLHVQAATARGDVHDEFIAELMAPLTGPETRSHRTTPGKRLPTMYSYPDE